jgi:hypothetical protein
MPGRLVEIRYPDNYFEIEARTENPPPALGDTLHRRGKLWRVTARTEGPPVSLHVVAVGPLHDDIPRFRNVGLGEAEVEP